jgi:anti-sigma factor RsiW
MNWFLNRCERHRESICLLASGVLPEPERREVENHLAACAGCRKYYNEIKLVALPLANWEKNFAHIEPDQTLRARWAKAVQGAGEPKPDRPFSPRPAFSARGREILYPLRWHLAGMSTAWLVVALLNAEPSPAPAVVMSREKDSPSARQLLMALRENRRQLLELIEAPVTEPAPPPRAPVPPPRSELRSVTLMG